MTYTTTFVLQIHIQNSLINTQYLPIRVSTSLVPQNFFITAKEKMTGLIRNYSDSVLSKDRILLYISNVKDSFSLTPYYILNALPPGPAANSDLRTRLNNNDRLVFHPLKLVLRRGKIQPLFPLDIPVL